MGAGVAPAQHVEMSRIAALPSEHDAVFWHAGRALARGIEQALVLSRFFH